MPLPLLPLTPKAFRFAVHGATPSRLRTAALLLASLLVPGLIALQLGFVCGAIMGMFALQMTTTGRLFSGPVVGSVIFLASVAVFSINVLAEVHPSTRYVEEYVLNKGANAAACAALIGHTIIFAHWLGHRWKHNRHLASALCVAAASFLGIGLSITAAFGRDGCPEHTSYVGLFVFLEIGAAVVFLIAAVIAKYVGGWTGASSAEKETTCNIPGSPQSRANSWAERDRC